MPAPGAPVSRLAVMEAFFAVVMAGTVLAAGAGALVAVRRLNADWPAAEPAHEQERTG